MVVSAETKEIFHHLLETQVNKIGGRVGVVLF